jgi:hypothetical protein
MRGRKELKQRGNERSKSAYQAVEVEDGLKKSHIDFNLV